MRGELSSKEVHPASRSALEYLSSLGLEKLFSYREAFATTAIEGNRLAEICNETLQRLINKDPVGDRYLLGLAWTIMRLEDNKLDEIRTK